MEVRSGGDDKASQEVKGGVTCKGATARGWRGDGGSGGMDQVTGEK